MSEVLILGGGLSGAAAATLLARAGRDVHLIERSQGPHHKVCGEFLSIEARRHLLELGIDAENLGATPISRIRLISGKHEVEAPLPFPALGLSRFRLDEALLERAAAAGARIERGVRVIEVGTNAVRTSAGERTGRHVMLATGKLSVRTKDPPDRPADDDPFVGFKMHYRLPGASRARLAEVIQLMLIDGGYAGLQLIEGGKANFCLVIRRSRLTAIGGTWPDIEAMMRAMPGKGSLLADAEPLYEKPVAIANLAYGSSDASLPASDLFRLGDQAGMTASITGDGMAMALRSAFLAAQCLSEGQDAGMYRKRLHAQTRRQIRRAMALQTVAERPWFSDPGMIFLKLWPGALTRLTAATRLPARASIEPR